MAGMTQEIVRLFRRMPVRVMGKHTYDVKGHRALGPVRFAETLYRAMERAGYSAACMEECAAGTPIDMEDRRLITRFSVTINGLIAMKGAKEALAISRANRVRRVNLKRRVRQKAAVVHRERRRKGTPDWAYLQSDAELAVLTARLVVPV